MKGIEITLVDKMGSDASVSNSARVSFNKWKDEFDEQDEKLIKYLASHKHMTPFRHTQVQLRCKAPIFLVRQLGKHQAGLSWNEVSRRYVKTEPEFFFPEEWRSRPTGSVKQGSGTEKLPSPDFKEGFCIHCGSEIVDTKRTQGGGRRKKYCSVQCKSDFTNKHRNPYKAKFDNAKTRAMREGKEWDLNFDTFEFPEYCKYLGLKLNYDQGNGVILPESPSFDRIDSSKGYVEGNVEIISNRANSMKNDAPIDEQIKMAEAVLLRYKGYIPDYEHSYEGVVKKSADLYQKMLQAGYAPEQARMVLPQSMLTEWIWSGNILAFAHVYRERIADGAQEEAKAFAKILDSVIRPEFPVAWGALVDDPI
jgi:thymidylate synthase ThyX